MEGVYPDLKDSKYQSRTHYLEMRLKEAYDHWRSVYTDMSSLDQLRPYLERLPPKGRELFLDMSVFVFILFNELDRIPLYLQDAVAIVSICSIIERIQAAQQAYDSATESLTLEQRSIASEKLDYAKKYWIVRCRKCGLINPINRHHCNCGAFLYSQFMIGRLLELGHQEGIRGGF